jgi:hypothetical protein
MTIDGLAPGTSLRTPVGPSVSRIDLFPAGLLTTSPVAAEVRTYVPDAEMEPTLATLRAARTG